jgi:4-hydroxy-3-methylbut-2-enyl diphosphate reductase
MKKFEVPEHYRSNILGRIKEIRKVNDPRKKDHTPFVFQVGRTEFVIPRHFGFCYGVENAIEIAFRTVAENPGKRIFLLGEMIHNPQVNEDLIAEGIQF